MPLVLRQIRKPKWYKHPEVPWLQEGELQADALDDLSTKSNALSVWLVDNTGSNLGRVVAALAVGENGSRVITNFDYFLIDVQLIQEIGIKIQENPGKTLDRTANLWHSDLIELTASKLLTLAEVVRNKAEIGRKTQRNVIQYIRDSVDKNFIDGQQLSSDTIRKLG